MKSQLRMMPGLILTVLTLAARPLAAGHAPATPAASMSRLALLDPARRWDALEELGREMGTVTRRGGSLLIAGSGPWKHLHWITWPKACAAPARNVRNGWQGCGVEALGIAVASMNALRASPDWAVWVTPDDGQGEAEVRDALMGRVILDLLVPDTWWQEGGKGSSLRAVHFGPREHVAFRLVARGAQAHSEGLITRAAQRLHHGVFPPNLGHDPTLIETVVHAPARSGLLDLFFAQERMGTSPLWSVLLLTACDANPVKDAPPRVELRCLLAPEEEPGRLAWRVYESIKDLQGLTVEREKKDSATPGATQAPRPIALWDKPVVDALNLDQLQQAIAGMRDIMGHAP